MLALFNGKFRIDNTPNKSSIMSFTNTKISFTDLDRC